MDEFIKLYPDEPHPIPEEELTMLNLGDTSYKTTLTEKHKQRKAWEPINLKVIRAQIPGVIRKAYVKVGAKVTIGDKLVVLDAMKMKNDILATESGVVKEICVKIGEQVSKGTILVKLG
jgi:biotin carboxyl carrier protein